MNSAIGYSEGAEVPEDKTTDNELISAFMGIKPKMGNWGSEGSFINNKLIDTRYPQPYNEDWNLIMDVVDKIQDVEIVKNQVVRTCAEVTIYYKACKIEYFPDEDSGDEHDEFTCQTQGETKFDAVYKAVVEFIKWHNQFT